jgi:hypothetical protein
MIIDLSEIIRADPWISIQDAYHEIGTGIFLDDDISGFLLNIEVDQFLIQVIKDSKNYYWIGVWHLDIDGAVLVKDNLTENNLVKEIINCISFCKKYIKLQAFS